MDLAAPFIEETTMTPIETFIATTSEADLLAELDRLHTELGEAMREANAAYAVYWEGFLRAEPVRRRIALVRAALALQAGRSTD